MLLLTRCVNDDEAGHMHIALVAELLRLFLAELRLYDVPEHTPFLNHEIEITAQRAMEEVGEPLRLDMLMQILAYLGCSLSAAIRFLVPQSRDGAARRESLPLA